MEAADDQQEEEPEPERDVDLVIDHVDRQHAQTVKPDHNSERETESQSFSMLKLTLEWSPTRRSFGRNIL